MKKILVLLVTASWSLLLTGFAGFQSLPSPLKLNPPIQHLPQLIFDSPQATRPASPSSVSWLEDSWRTERLLATSA